jgi:hypothetical protein
MSALRTATLLATVSLVIGNSSSLTAWKNPRKSTSLDAPIFGTHDYIAYKAYVLAGRPAFIRNNLPAYFIGTEAPDNGLRPPDAEGTYSDAAQCHCIEFDEDETVTRDRAELRTRQEFDKAIAALDQGQRKLAAFYAGALAHYVGDLSQFCHVMGSQSHWGPEDDALHGNYEAAIEKTMQFTTRRSTLLDVFIKPIDVGGDTPETIARTVALRVERGTGDSNRHPGWMHEHYAGLKKQGLHLQPGKWDTPFRNQTGQNVNVAVNGIAKLLLMLLQEE